MLNKTNIKAIKMADRFIFATDNGQSHIRCIKKGLFDENEPFAQPDVHHDIQCDSAFDDVFKGSVAISIEDNAVVETVLNGLKDGDQLTLVWSNLGHGQTMLSMNIARKDKQLSYILALHSDEQELRQAA